MLKLRLIISGGQTGADRAALDWAIEHHMPHGGWCPKERKAEDGRVPDRYTLQETPSESYAERTELNIRDSDGTVIFSISPKLKGGSKATFELARESGRPLLHLCKESNLTLPPKAALLAFLETHGIKTLNIAGPRSSEAPKIALFVKSVLDDALADHWP